MNCTIFTGFAPNLRMTDVFRATTCLFQPWKWRKGEYINQLEQALKNIFGAKHVIAFDSGRSALQLALQACGIVAGDEVLLQAYTCVAVPNAVRWAGGVPVYVDIDETLTMDFADAEKKISSRTKAIIVQHTFGQATDMDACMLFTKEHNLIAIEDCAHTIGGKYKDKLLGTFGSAAIFSFGSDKVISCGRGGAVITNHDEIKNKLQEIRNKLPEVSLRRIFKQLMQYPVFSIGKSLYHLGVGKWLLWMARKISLTALILEPAEKKGLAVVGFPAQLPNVLAELVIRQLRSLNEANSKRIQTTEYYWEQFNKNLLLLGAGRGMRYNAAGLPQTNPLIRFPIFVDDPQALMRHAKKHGILLGDWYQTVIAPKDVDLEAVGYKVGSCPKAEAIARRSVNLPTQAGLSEKDRERIVDLLNIYKNEE